MLLPTSLKILDDRFLLIGWSDGKVLQTAIRILRQSCPCATCKEKHKPLVEKAEKPTKLSLPTLTQAEARPLKIGRMSPVGNYAYKIDFSDGHSSGLFTIELLRELGSPLESSTEEPVSLNP